MTKPYNFSGKIIMIFLLFINTTKDDSYFFQVDVLCTLRENHPKKELFQKWKYEKYVK